MKKQEKKDTTEEQILKAAFDAFEEKGLSDVRMQDIADRAGIARTVVNYYFRSKEKLIYKVAGNILRDGMPKMIEKLNGDLPLFEKITQFTAHYLDTITERPYMPLFLVSELGKKETHFFAEFVEELSPNIDAFSEQVYREVREGSIIDIHPLQLYMNMISICAFPVIGKGLFKIFTNTEDAQIEELLLKRKELVATTIIKSIKK